MGTSAVEISGVEHEFVEANGLRFHVASAGRGDALALCLHGFPECWFSWRYQIPLLARLGWRVWAPDLRGYGTSDKPEGVGAYRIETLLEDVAGLIDASGASRVMLVSHDWGGVLAWYFAMHRIRPIERLVAMNIPHPAAARAAFGWKQRLRSWYALFFQIRGLPEWFLGRKDAQAIARMFARGSSDPSRFPPEVVEVFRRSAAQPGALTAMIHYYRGLLFGGGAKRMQARGAPTIEVPTLLVWGEDDIALTKETTFGTDRYVSDLTLRYLPGVSHWVNQDAPEVVNAMLEAWLAGERVPEASDLAGTLQRL